jgi:hypothetical protein
MQIYFYICLNKVETKMQSYFFRILVSKICLIFPREKKNEFYFYFLQPIREKTKIGKHFCENLMFSPNEIFDYSFPMVKQN